MYSIFGADADEGVVTTNTFLRNPIAYKPPGILQPSQIQHRPSIPLLHFIVK